ncbi:DUF7281 domain-containing protein [Thalassotalea profundi]|uniref:DUF7281 domain-containing protein n=1 Tax=Thalassotalea profundi TaxID=2036687 RepID=A0ABQ3IIC9_9GAMM|nr:DUF2220 family protein [Thalassotalea profundi]GHE80182.1 hypothetical protein GCM10011501_05020 [Thalassotalea profundi]
MSSLSHNHLSIILDILIKGKREKLAGKVTHDLNKHYGVGTQCERGKKYRYTVKDVQVLHRLLDNIGINPHNPPKSNSSRTDNGFKTPDEKFGAKAVFPNPICVKVVELGCSLNNFNLVPSGVAHYQINLDDIINISAQSIVLVENLDTFKEINQSRLEMNLSGVIFIWRGGISGISHHNESKLIKTISLPNTEKTAHDLAKKYEMTLGYYGDFDIAGLNIASRLNLDFIILPELKETESIRGNKELFKKQQILLNNQSWPDGFSQATANYFAFLTTKKQAYTQERTSALKIKHLKVDILS